MFLTARLGNRQFSQIYNGTSTLGLGLIIATVGVLSFLLTLGKVSEFLG